MNKLSILLLAAVTAWPLTAVGLDDRRTDETDEGPKVAVCHRPPGNPSKAKTLCIAESSVADHLKHGDSRGSCPAKGNARDRGTAASGDKAERDVCAARSTR